MRRTGNLLLLCGLAWLAVAPAPAADPIKPDDLPGLLAQIKPDADGDAWEKVPWLTDLWEARKRAAAQGKPILLWEMDGHPLGCV